MSERLNIGSPPIEVSVRRSARARRLSLRVSRLDGRVTLTLPRRVPLREGARFIQEREPWVRAQLAQLAPRAVVAFGQSLPLRGRLVTLTPGAVRVPRLEEGRLIAPKDAERLPVRLRSWLKEQARQDLTTASDRYAAALGEGYARITLRDTRSRWGSCSSARALMYSWRLIMAPPEVLDYVAAHEVAHLVEMNHSEAFWRIVGGLCPDWRAHRDWLHRNGPDLHRVDFGD
ncbi:MAG: zinc metalloprotease [Rhodobacterales bacterium]|nr:MAG: zinc metalloprotease [Rhodobacterales bacterium]